MAKLELRAGAEVYNISGTTILGRSHDSDIHIVDETLSKNHASLWKNARGQYVLEDLKSRNGTFVNSVRIKKRILNDGDIIQAGMQTFVFHFKPQIDINPGYTSQVLDSIDVEITEKESDESGLPNAPSDHKNRPGYHDLQFCEPCNSQFTSA